MSTTVSSFYIPRMSCNYDETGVKIAFSFLNIGDVNRVDFNPLPSSDGSNGSNASASPEFQSAFVHITRFYFNPIADNIQKKVINEEEAVRVYPDFTDATVYWILLKNKNPVTETRLNIHQMADIMQKQREMIEEQHEMIDKMKEEIVQLKDVHEYDMQCLEYHIKDLMEQFKKFQKACDESGTESAGTESAGTESGTESDSDSDSDSE